MIVLRSALFNLVGVAWTLCFTVIFLPFLLCPPRTVRFVVGFWANVTARLLALTVGLEVEVRGRENSPEEPAIFASKHQSTWDTIVFHCITRKAVYVVKRELFLILLTNRVHPTRDNRAILEVRGRLADAVIRALAGS